MSNKRKLTSKTRKILEKAYEGGFVRLGGICPSCCMGMGYMNHGKCNMCGKGCGCSFNPTSSGNYCDFHRYE